MLASDPEDREELGRLLGELGYAAHGAARLEEALELARDRRVQAVLVADGGTADAETATRELIRAFPLMPVVVAQTRRDAGRAVALMRVGAAEVAAPPWTKEDLKATVSKSLRFRGTALAPVPVAPRRLAPVWFALAAGVFFASALGVASLRRAESARRAAAARVDSWELPVRHPAGLAHDGSGLWVVEWFTQSLYSVTPEGAVVNVVRHLTAETPVAATFTGEALWLVGADGTVTRRMRDQKMTELGRWRRVAPNCAGVAFDGLYLWTLDGRAKLLRQHVLDGELTEAGRWRWTGEKAAGLAWDGRLLWTLDAAGRRLSAHAPERPGDIVAARSLPEFASGAFTPTGLAWDGGRFWTVAEARDGGPARLSRLPEDER